MNYIILLYQDSCLQCDYVKQTLKKEGVLKLIKLVNRTDDGFDSLCKIYNISKVPTVLVFDKDRQLKDIRVINTKADIQWIVDTVGF